MDFVSLGYKDFKKDDFGFLVIMFAVIHRIKEETEHLWSNRSVLDDLRDGFC